MASDNRKNSHSLDEQQSRFKLTALARAVKAIGKRRQNSPHKQIKFESLEPRVLLSADPLSATLASTFGDDWSQQSETLELSTDALAYLSPVLESAGQETGWFRESVDPYGETLVLGRSLDELRVESGTNNWIVDESATQVERHIAFVDSHVEGYESLLDNILPVANNEGGSVPVIEVVLLDADRDGVEQIAEYLANQQGISAIHVLAHGSEGSLSLGSAILDSESLDDYSAQLGGWGSALTVDADILLYGCNVASGEWGVEFVQNLAVLTGADVTASDDATGNVVLGGDWDLELQVGAIEALAIDEMLDVGQLTSLLQDGVVVSTGSGIFSGYSKDDSIAGGILDLRNVSNPLTWTIGADGQVSIESNDGSLKIKDVTILKAGTGQNDFIILNNAEFGSSSQAASIIGNGTSTTLSFTPNLADPDELFTSNRVSSGIDGLDLDSTTDVIRFGKVWFTAADINKVVGGKGNDEFDGGDAQSSILVGGRGDDILTGGSQPGDLLQGGAGNDFLIGNAGSDFLEGGDGEDFLYGGGGNSSFITPEAGTDSLAGGRGDDSYFFFGNWGKDLVDEKADEGDDTLDFFNANVALRVDVGVSALTVDDGIVVTDISNAENRAEAANVEIVTLGTAANSIFVTDMFAQNGDAKLTVINALNTTQTVQDGALATLDLTAISSGVNISIEQSTYRTEVNGSSVANPNGNKVTVTFESGAKLIVFNVKSIDGTGKDDTVTFKDGAVLDGNLELGDGSNEVIISGDASKISGVIFAGDGFDLLRIGSGVKVLDSLTADDENVISSISDVIRKVKGLAETDVLDVDALYGIQLSVNPTGLLPFDTFAFDAIIVDQGGSTGAAVGVGDALRVDVTGERNLLQGGSQDDILIGGPDAIDIKGGKGKDIIVSGSGDEVLSGEAGADTYVFRDGWGYDKVTRGLTESADNTLDFSLVTTNLSFVLRSSKVFVGSGTDAGFKFNYDNESFDSADSTVTAERKILPLTTNTAIPGTSNSIDTIKLPGSGVHKFEFGNSWGATKIEATDGAQLVLDFSRVYEELRFDFKKDGSLVVTRLGGLKDTLKDVIPDAVLSANSITISKIDANTQIISGSNSNIYRVESGATFDGNLNLFGGAKKIRIPLTEKFVDIPTETASRLLLGDVQHTIDLGQSAGDEFKDLAGDVGATLVVLGDLFTLNLKDAAIGLKDLIKDNTNSANLAFSESARGVLSGVPGVSENLIEGIANVNLLNGAEIDNVVLGGFALNLALGDLFVPPVPGTSLGDFGDNTFSTKQFRPGLHVVSGLTGADEYEFNNLWGLALVLEIPDLDLGVPIPDATDKLDFSGVIGQDIIVDVYSNVNESGSDFIELLNELSIPTDWLNGADTSNFIVARAVIGGVTVSTVVATDIESLIGPSALSTMTVRFHGDATLVGTVAPGLKGEVVLDYSDYSTGVQTALDTGLFPTGDFGLENIGADFFFNSLGIDNPAASSTTGSATGIEGNRFGGLTTLFDVFSELSGDEQRGLLADFGADTVTKVIGSAQADTHQLASKPKEYVLGTGDSIIAPQPVFGLDGLDFGGLLKIRDTSEVGETTLRFDASTAAGVNLNLTTGELLIDGTMSSVLAPSNGSTDDFTYIIYSGPGDDSFTGSTGVDTLIFEGDWGHDTIDLTAGKTAGVFDKLDFSLVSVEMRASVDADGNLKLEKADGSSSVTVIGGLDADGLVDFIGIDDLVSEIRALRDDSLTTTLVAAQPSVLQTLDVSAIEGLVADAMRAYDGKSLTLFEDPAPAVPAGPVTLSFVDLAADGSPVAQLVRQDTGEVLLDASTLSFSIGNLPGTELSTRDAAGAITVDTTAADNGWYTAAADPAIDETGVDLLSVLVYEIGLKLGIDPSLAFMSPPLDAGDRVSVAGDVTADDLGLQVDTTTQTLTAFAVASLPAASITDSDDLSAILAEAISRWSLQQFSIAGTPWVDPTSVLAGVNVLVDDLDGDELAKTLENGEIVLDYTAAGHGWFVDEAPFDNVEFAADGLALPGGPADGRVDLLTVLMHELGHKLGVDHTDAAGSPLMSTEIGPGERRDIPGGTIVLFPLEADDVTALDAGLGAFSIWAGALGKNLDDYLGNTSIPFTDKSIPELLGITSSAENLVLAATTELKDAVSAALADGSPSAADILAIDGSAVSPDYTFTVQQAPNANPNAFIATFDLLPAGDQTIDFDLSSLQLDDLDFPFGVSGDLSLTVNADLTLTVEFGLDGSDAFYVRSPDLSAELSITDAPGGFNPGISLGPISLSVVDGEVDVSGSARVGFAGVIDTAGLTANTVDPSALDPATNAKYAINLPIALAGGIGGVDTENAAIRASGILPTSPANLLGFLQGMDIQFENFDQLFQLRGISLDQLLDGIVAVIDSLVGTNQDGLLYKEIPGIGDSVADLLSEELGLNGADVLGKIRTEVLALKNGQSLSGVEDALNGIFNDLFGAGTDPVEIRLEDSVLIVDLSFEKVVAQFQKSLNIDLAAFASQLGLDALIGPDIIDDVADKLQIGGTDINLFADILVGFDLGFGLDLRNVLDPEQIISSDTGIFVKLDAGLDPLLGPYDFDVSLDISDLGLEALGLSIPLDEVGFGVRDAMADLDLLLEFGLPENDDGFYDIDAIPPAEISATGQAAIDLPLVIGTFPIGGTTDDLNGDGFADNVLHVGATFTDGDFDFEFASPGMDKLISLAGFLNDPENIVKGLDKIFKVLEDKVGGQLTSLNLPFIGDAVSDAAGFIDDGVDGSGDDLREKVVGKLEQLIAANPGKTTIELVAQALVEGLQDISPDVANSLGITVGSDFVEFNLEIASTILNEEFAIDLGIGDILEFGPDGVVVVDLGYTFAFGFGFSISDGFYLNTDGATEGGEEFALDLSATVNGLDVTGTLPILAVSIRDLTGDMTKDNDDLASGIFGSFSIDLRDDGNDGRLSIGESATVEARLVAEANVDLGLTVSIPSPDTGSPIFPTINTTFRYDQILADIGTSGSTIAATPTVVFEDVELNLGEFISGFVQPIIDVVSVATEPLEPLVDFLNEPITLLMDLLGSDDDITLLTIAQGLADSGIIESSKVESALKFIGALSDIVNLVGDVEGFIKNAGDGPILINFGSFTVSGGAAQPDAGNPTAPADQAGSTDPEAGNLVAGFSEGGFRFPLLTDPSTIFGLLLGETVDLFIYDLPALGLDFNYVKSFPIYPGLNARFGGAISASTNIGFGFDTSGFNAWKEGGFLASDIPLIFDGLFLDDHVTFDDDKNIISDDPEATISATIIAGASVGVPGLIEAGVDGGITGGLEFDLNDLPNENTGPGTPLPAEYDGKLRGRELLTRFQQTDELFPGFVIPCVFDINGTVSFGLDAFFWVGIDLGFFGKATIFEARTTFLSGVLASFDFSCPDPEPASLANVNETTGEVALIANRADGAFTVTRETVEVDDVPQEFLVIRTGASFQYIEYDKVSKLVFNGTEGNDQIVIGAGLDGIELHIDGKGGNDRIAVASGGLAATRVFIRGGADNDEIVVAETVLGNLDIDGGAGNDNIMVSSDGSNTVLIHGGSGNDKIIGSEYADTIYGDGGRDVLLGLGGADIIYGGDLDQAALDAEIAALPAGALPPSIDDLIYGGDDDDQIFGGSGNDRLLGESGNDTLHGEDGDDSLTGGVDIDVLMGGADRDTIVWSYGDGEDSLWDGGDGFTLESDKLVDTVQISGVVFDSTGATIATDDTVSLSQDGVTDDVAVNWARTGVPGSDNAFSLTNVERISIDLGSGNDELTVNDLDLTTIDSLSVDFGTTETITTAIVNAGTENEEEFLVRNVDTDSGTDVLNLFGSGDKDIFEVESTTTGLLIQQSKGTSLSSRNILDVSIFNPGSSTDRLNIDTGDNDDIIDASAVFRNDLTAIGFTAGADQDIVIGSPFIDDIDSGAGNDQVTGGAGVDLFTDASGDDKLFEARDVNYTLSDVELVVETLEVGTVVLNAAGEPEVLDENGNLLPGTVAVRQPDGSIKVTRAVTGVEVEDISGIFEEVYLTGASLSEGIDGAFSVNVFNVADFTGDAFLNGSAAADIYNIQLSGGAAATFTSFIDIIDDGGADNAGIDVLNIEGTNEADTFRFDKDIVERISGAADGMFSRVENFSTDIIKRPKGDLDPNISVQTVNYLTTEDMVIHGRGGDDLFVVDDSSTELFVYGDSGDDSFFIGSVLKTRMVPNPNGSGMIEVVDRDGGLTNGVSFPAMFYGGKGNDYFEVNHNIAEISLFGQDGDDIFFLKALLTTEPNSTDNYQAQEDINVYSEAGESDTLAYVNNAPVNIFGGEGFDTLVIVGTVIDDTFVIFTEFDVDLGRMVQRIYGAGLVVPVIDSIERIQLITGAGDDTVFLYGTLDDQEILINTGGGNDIVQIGGDEFSFDVTIPESQYTKINFIPQPDLVDVVIDITPSRTWYTIGYDKLFGFFGPAWIPKLIRNFTPELRIPRIVRTPQADLEVPEVVTVPEFNLEITVPESRNLESISGPVFIDGQLADGGDDAIIVDNRNGLTSNPGVLQKTTVEAADINTTDAEVAAAKLVLAETVPAGVDVDVVYGSVASYLQDQNRVRQQGLLDGMLANQGGTTTVDLRPGQRIQAFNNLAAFKAYLPTSAAQGSYTEVNSVTGITETKTFSISSLLSSGGNEFLPDDVFTVNVGGDLGVVEAELLYDVNGDLTGVNVFAEIELTFDLGNDFVRSKTVDTDSTRIYDALSGFGLGVGIFYENFTLIDLQLSNDHDVLTINDTTADAVTNVFAGGGDDRIEVNDTSGTLNIFGDVAGSDTAGLGITSSVAGTYSEDFTDADNAAKIGQVLVLGGSFDADNVNHIRALIKVLNVEFPATVNVPDPDSTIFKKINLDVFDFRAQIWELLKSEVNTLLGETGDYRNFLGGAGEFANFSTDLGNYVGVAGTFNPGSQAHLAALAVKVNAKGFSLTVEIDLAGNANSLSRDLGVYSSLVSQLLGPDGLDIADGATIDDYRNFLPEIGVALQLGQDFDVNNRSHLQFLAGLVNNERFNIPLSIDANGTTVELTAALETFESFVWRTLKEDLQRASGTPYNQLAETGDYRTQLSRLGSILGLPGAFDAGNVNDVKLLGARLNSQFNDLGIDVDGIRLEPNIDLGQYELEIWKLITDVNPLIEVPSGNDTFNVQRSGAEIFIWGQRGNDIVNLNNASLGAWLTALGQQGDDDFNVYDLQTLATFSDRGDGRGLIRDSVDFDGGSETDEYYFDLTGGDTDYRINVLDTGTADEDTLTIEGTSAADTFLMRRVTELPGYSADSPAFVALLHGTIEEILANEATRPDTYERINYDSNIDGFLRVNGLGGDDYFASDDNATTMILDGGADKDTFQIGQVYRTPRVDDSVNSEDAFSTIETTRGFLSRGVSYQTQIIGGTEDDRIVVYSNAAELTLEGNGGNDSFEVRAFELAAGGFSTESDTDINTGDGDDTVQYNVNAPVNIDGGTGFDTIVVLGTESDDNFVVTAGAIYGAGLFVSYSGAESIQIDGLEGDDTFFILGTAEEVLTTVIGGLGSDTFNVGGDVTEAITSVGWDDGDNVRERTLTDIRGPLVIEGHYLEGANRSLSAPVMLPGEISDAIADGDVLSFLGTGESSALDLMQVATTALAAVITRINSPEVTEFADLVGFTLEITDGSGEGRFWSIEGITQIDADTWELELRNPSVLESAGIADIGVPGNDSAFAVSQLNPSFFADETDQVDTLNVFNDGSVVDDTGTLAAIDVNNSLVTLEAAINLSGLGMGTGFVADLGTADTGDDITFVGGITADDLEIFEVLLGQGNDTLTIEDTLRNPETTHGGITIVHGGGNQEVAPGVMGGDHIIVNGGGGASSPLVVYGDTSQDGSRYAGTADSTPETLANSFDNAGNDVIDARNASESVTLYGGAGDDEIWGGSAGDNLAGGSGNDEIHGQGGTDLIYGDSGINVDSITRFMEVPTVDTSTNPNHDDLAVGNDTLHGDGGEDVVFGDHGIVTQADPDSALWTTEHAAINRIESTVITEGGDDIIYGGDQADILIGGSNTLNGTRGGDAIDGGNDDDLIFGDNVVLEHRAAGSGQTADPRLRTLDGAEIYVTGGPDDGEVAPNSSVNSGHPQVTATWAEYLITDLNHSASIEAAGDRNFGDDYIAGGADDDTIFGQLGDDVIQGDGSIGDGINARVGASRDQSSGALLLDPSVEAATDGDDYIEGNGGNDVIFGNLGQDDIVGGSSSLFTLVDADLRPDGSDILFGGSGQRVERNYQVPVGDDANPDTIVLGSLHAEDSDAIAGDNANIYRLVGTNGSDTGAFLSFQYDAGRGAESIIVRAVDLIDYTPGGSDYDPVNAQSDIGAGDEIHGGPGDDFIYGMKGSDLLFGDSEDDDLIGGYGNDWISGGAGSDGVLGDDGRIYTSRNTQSTFAGQMAEPLYGIGALAETNVEISTPGNAQQAIINVAGELKKTVNLTPFNVDPLEDNLYDAQDADDIIFGGLGDDFLHGGSGDDAISGAEAIAGGFAILYPAGSPSDASRTDGIAISFGFDNPMNPGNILGFGALRAGEFAEYDEFNPRHRIVSGTGEEYFLNFNTNEGEEVEPGIFSDGDDVIFGDLGNDWMLGGTGQDNMYGGRGNDLLNADDDHSTNGGLNDTTDTADSYADRAFGGAGRDVMIANTGLDRLIDWAGQFNTYLVPFAPFGPPTISRALPPSLFDFLYDLSASDGADPTRAADEGSDAARNGEPFGELGLIIQKDFDWQAQTGAPDDPMPGNIPGGSRDVVRQATFNQGTADSFLPDVGDWSVSGSRLQVSPETLGGDAVSVYYADVVLPTYFEMQATIQGGKPTGGLKSNAYLIFDYQSPTDFKFAGVNVSTDKLEMGHRDESGWHIDVSTNAKLRPNTDYNLLLALNGTAATLVVNNKDVLNFAFEARVDPDGYSYGFNSGMVGIGAFNSVASIDNVKLQVLPRDVEMIRQSDFDSGPVDFLTGDSVGQWQIANGYLVGDGSVGGLSTAWGGQIAYTTSDVRIAAEQVVEIEATLEAGATGGIVFDQYGETDFKFVYIDESGVVSIGHQTGQRWDIEASAQMPNQVTGDYDIRVALVGTTVSVIIDNQTVVSYAYNALTGDGAIGLLAAGSNARFDNVSISTNDSAYLDANTGDALRAAGDAASTPGITLEDGVNLQPLLDASVERWSSWLGETLPGANGLSIWITDLPDELLGLTVGDVIYVDSDAAGRGWFVDETPKYDNEFDATGNALAGTDAANGIDLLSVIAHEVGHVLGYDHDTLQTSTLSVGTRLVPEIRDAGDQPLHRNAEIPRDLLSSLTDMSKRIVPVNLGMFGAMHRQIPWAFPDDASLADSDLHAMMWNEEAGEFETAKPVKPARIADDRPGILEFLEETGDWHR